MLLLLGRRAVDPVLEVERTLRKLALERGRDAALVDVVLDRAPELVGEARRPALVARVERVGDRVASGGEVGRDLAWNQRLGRFLGAAPATREREGQPQGDEGEQRPQAGNSTDRCAAQARRPRARAIASRNSALLMRERPLTPSLEASR